LSTANDCFVSNSQHGANTYKTNHFYSYDDRNQEQDVSKTRRNKVSKTTRESEIHNVGPSDTSGSSRRFFASSASYLKYDPSKVAK